VKHHALTVDDEIEIARRVALRRQYANKNLMAEFGCSRSLIDRIAREGPRETKQKVSIENLFVELQQRGVV
jgi:hypothetical protein